MCAIGRDVFEELGGFDERFGCAGATSCSVSTPCTGQRNVCSPFGASVTSSPPRAAPTFPERLLRQPLALPAFGSIAGDPYFSPNLSLTPEPQLRSRFEPTPAERVAEPLGRA